MSELPLVSIIIPCRNEEKFISRCLDSIVANDYPKERVEVLVLDGMSKDGTREIIKRYAHRYTFIRLLGNPERIIPAAMNFGIRSARGEIIMKMDAHSTYPRDYMSSCVRYLREYEAENVGGIWKIVPGADTTIAKGIAHALGHPFASGNAYIKVGSKEPQWTDAVAFGCYRRDIFQKIGPWNEELAGSSDMDVNARLRAVGGRILLVPEIVLEYYVDPDLQTFWGHNFSDGVWATYVLKFGSKAWSWRHWVPLAFVLSVIGSGALSAFFPTFRWLLGSIMGAYAVSNLGASFHLAIQKRCVSYLWTAPIIFAIRHVAHGLGASLGLLLVLVPGKSWKGRRGRDV